MMKLLVLLVSILGIFPVDFVNTLQGTDSDKTLSYGCTYPCTTMPQGTHAWSPRTRGPENLEKYVWKDSLIVGFDLTHMFNMWMRDYDVLTFMPQMGKPEYDWDKRGVAFSHDEEVGRPHYYKVRLANGIVTEIAPTEKCAILRFTYPSAKSPLVVIDGSIDESSFEISDNTVKGWIKNLWWDNPSKEMKCYFVIRFDRPVKSFEKLDGKISLGFAGSRRVQAKVACSFISPEMAVAAYEREISDAKNLEEIKARGAEIWNKRLGKIKVEGGSEEQKKTFYTCLYRASCFPRKMHEETQDGRLLYFSPYDGLIHEGRMYADMGQWDAYHSLMPLNCLVNPVEHGYYLASFLDSYAQGGWLPAYSSPGESGMMTGNHAISLLADGWAKGIRTFNPSEALEAYQHDVTHKGPVMDAIGRPEWEDWFTLGYVPEQDERGCSTSKTLEYAYDDFCAWKLACDAGETHKADIFARQMYNYRNVFDKESGFMRGRCRDGKWSEPFDPLAWDGYFAFESRAYCEGNAWHWTWAVKHDVEGLARLFGSRERFISKLDSVFSQPVIKPYGRWAELEKNEMMDMTKVPLGQYAHGNEPIHHLAYLYDYVGQPWKTQKLVRTIMDGLYSSGPKGYPGDEDQGAMSSWYVLSATGLYCVTPGVDQYALGSPLFDKITISESFTIEAENNSPENVYIQSATLNGKPLERNYITHQEILSGGILHLVMGPSPNTLRGISDDAAPYSCSQTKDK